MTRKGASRKIHRVTAVCVLAHLRAICRTLQDAPEIRSWGIPTWRVGGCERCMFLAHEGNGPGTISFRCEPTLRVGMLADARFIVPPSGGEGWISLDLALGRIDWNEIESLVRASYTQAVAEVAQPAIREQQESRAAAAAQQKPPQSSQFQPKS